MLERQGVARRMLKQLMVIKEEMLTGLSRRELLLILFPTSGLR